MAILKLANQVVRDLSAVTQKKANTNAKFLQTSCKRFKEPTQNELAAPQLEITTGMTQTMHQRSEKKTASPVQESVKDVFGKMVVFEIK